MVPIFARLRPHFDDAWELAPAGPEFVVSGPQADGYRAAVSGPSSWAGCNMRETFIKLIRRAGLLPWPRVFHNLRASCETDLMKEHPIHVVAARVGNTPKIAVSHCLQRLDGNFEKAVKGDAKSDARATQTPAQARAGGNGQEATKRPQPVRTVGLRSMVSAPVDTCRDEQIRLAGLEPTSG